MEEELDCETEEAAAAEDLGLVPRSLGLVLSEEGQEGLRSPTVDWEAEVGRALDWEEVVALKTFVRQ